MPLALVLPDEYGYVLLSALSTTLVPVYHSMVTSRFRKAAKVPYPNAYASANDAATSKDKYLFNCAQRAHSNLTENHTNFIVWLMISGLQFPMLSAWSGVVFTLGRLAYVWGYTNPKYENGKGRFVGVWWEVPHFLMLGTGVWTAWGLVKGRWGM